MTNQQAGCGGQARTSVTPLRYWELVIKGYCCGDVRALLDPGNSALRDKAGPVLDSVMAGIDAAGGCLYRFTEPSGFRSVQFMLDEMHLDKALAEVLYDRARCGMVHEGVTKSGIEFHRGKPACENYQSAGWAGVYKKNGMLAICVDCFAWCFLKAVRNVNDGKILCTPEPPSQERQELLKSVLAALSKTCECGGDQGGPTIDGVGTAPPTSSRTPCDR